MCNAENLSVWWINNRVIGVGIDDVGDATVFSADYRSLVESASFQKFRKGSAVFP